MLFYAIKKIDHCQTENSIDKTMLSFDKQNRQDKNKKIADKKIRRLSKTSGFNGGG